MPSGVTVQRSPVAIPNAAARAESTTEPVHSSLRRLACDACRARKIRCDKQSPTCSRCAKIGSRCRYTSRTKPALSKIDLSQFLITLNQRLKHAEAQLAVNPPTQQSQLPVISWNDADVLQTETEFTSNMSPLQMNSALFSAQDPQCLTMLADNGFDLHSLSEWPDGSTTDFQRDKFVSTMPDGILQARLALEEHQNFELDPMFIDIASTPPEQQPFATSSSLMQTFYDHFFETMHPILPIISRSRFQTELMQVPSTSCEIQLLCYAVGVLGAFSVPELRCHVDKCYNEARNLLDIFERQDNSASLTNINTLQACVLLTLYEFKRPNFTRAWMTLGRAIRLAKIMGLDKVDRMPNATQPWGLQVPTATQLSAADVEERRRTFWVLYVFDAFASVRTNSGSAFDKVISVPLPTDHEYPDSADANETMPALTQVFEQSRVASFSPLAGTAIMVSLYQRCFDHIQSSLHELSYTFWETHYSIDKGLSRCRTLLSQHLSNDDPQNLLSLTLRMNLNTVEITLHEAALGKIEKDDLPMALNAESTRKCGNAAIDIVEALQIGQTFVGKRREALKQLDQFMIWPITVAIQVCFRMLYHGNDDVSRYIRCLYILSSSMKDFVDPEHIPPGLLEKADASIAEFDSSI